MPGSRPTPIDRSNVEGFDELFKNFDLPSQMSSDEREQDRGEENGKRHGVEPAGLEEVLWTWEYPDNKKKQD